MKEKSVFEYIMHELKECENKTLFSLGIDESYANSGIAITVGNPFGEYKTIDCINLNGKTCQSKNDYRVEMLSTISQLITKHEKVFKESTYKLCLVERIRQFSKGFINMDYIKNMGALIAYIVEAANQYNLNTYSVDTRCWKNTVIGNCQPMINSYNITPEKYPTIEYVIKHDMRQFIFSELSEMQGVKELNKKHPKNVFKSATYKYIHVDDDKADAICISRFAFSAMENNRNLDDLLKLED